MNSLFTEFEFVNSPYYSDYRRIHGNLDTDVKLPFQCACSVAIASYALSGKLEACMEVASQPEHHCILFLYIKLRLH